MRDEKPAITVHFFLGNELSINTDFNSLNVALSKCGNLRIGNNFIAYPCDLADAKINDIAKIFKADDVIIGASAGGYSAAKLYALVKDQNPVLIGFEAFGLEKINNVKMFVRRGNPFRYGPQKDLKIFHENHIMLALVNELNLSHTFYAVTPDKISRLQFSPNSVEPKAGPDYEEESKQHVPGDKYVVISNAKLKGHDLGLLVAKASEGSRCLESDTKKNPRVINVRLIDDLVNCAIAYEKEQFLELTINNELSVKRLVNANHVPLVNGSLASFLSFLENKDLFSLLLLNNRDFVNLSLTCKALNAGVKQNLAVRKLFNGIKDGKFSGLDNVQLVNGDSRILSIFPSLHYGRSFRDHPLYKAALAFDKVAFQCLLNASNPSDQVKVSLNLMYQMITGEGNLPAKSKIWKFTFEETLGKIKQVDRQIQVLGKTWVGGKSIFQIAAANLEINKVRALLISLVEKPADLVKMIAKIEDDPVTGTENAEIEGKLLSEDYPRIEAMSLNQTSQDNLEYFAFRSRKLELKWKKGLELICNKIPIDSLELAYAQIQELKKNLACSMAVSLLRLMRSGLVETAVSMSLIRS